MEGISITKLLVIGALIVLLFGTNKLRTLGSDLGAAIKGFKKSMSDEQPTASTQDEHPAAISEKRSKE
ncbi:Sec-independent protein translocase subunit TatA [Dickeya undicola]|uniref:Probable Sec-independent protein translocase protein TatE n=1 Tax=Dickeya undicola TaxID=1577887 RepID=A0A3N0G1M5_9GAMM|nr:Sec-independent protein translocase subunit TatA [Dickeya undicola]RNM06131.1 twin-arginine translocase subunit TatE [Dickeya undicola]RNM28696.1 twin-arginine translocase subunit TatE [Dickeya undicola]